MIRSSDRKQFVRIMRWDNDGTQPIDDRKLAQRVIPQPVKGVLHPRLTGRNFKLTHYSWLGWLACGLLRRGQDYEVDAAVELASLGGVIACRGMKLRRSRAPADSRVAGMPCCSTRVRTSAVARAVESSQLEEGCEV